MKYTSTAAVFVSPSYKMNYYGSVLDLDSFFGPIKLNENTFTSNVLKYQSCNLASNMDTAIFGGTDNYPVYGSKTNLQIRSVISVVKHWH
jgi:hypothetical protein